MTGCARLTWTARITARVGLDSGSRAATVAFCLVVQKYCSVVRCPCLVLVPVGLVGVTSTRTVDAAAEQSQVTAWTGVGSAGLGGRF